jgi:hypothetical protein
MECSKPAIVPCSGAYVVFIGERDAARSEWNIGAAAGSITYAMAERRVFCTCSPEAEIDRAIG